MDFSIEMLLSALNPLIAMYGGELGFLPQLISIIGTLRLFIKPLMGLVDTYVMSTSDKKDDEKWDKIKEGKVFQTAVYFLDWFASIKIKK